MSKSQIFINPNGILCKTIYLYSTFGVTKIDISPRFDGYDVNNNIINPNDWMWIN